MAHAHSIREYPKQMTATMALSAAIGAGLALLFTPRTGKQHREKIKLQAATAYEKVKRNQRKVADKAEPAAKQTKAAASRAKAITKAKATTAKRATRRAASDTKDMADQIRRNGEP